MGDAYKVKMERLKLGLRKTSAAVVPGPDADAMIWQVERKGNYLKRFTDFCLEVKARIWP